MIEDPYILQTVAYIEQNYATRLSVNDLLERIPLSRRILEKRFKQNTGLTLYQFIQRYRIDHFARQLISTRRAVKDIAFSCGFDDCKNLRGSSASLSRCPLPPTGESTVCTAGGILRNFKLS